MRLVKWEKLPEEMRNEAVRPYYEILKKHSFSLFVKRFADIVMSLILIIILLIPLVILAVWIKLDSEGPIIFKQERVTQFGKTFRVFKFRTMVQNADKIGAQVTTDSDPRITKVGNKLRNLRLDEIPQLFNVLIGDMSFVGTRPEVRRYVERYSDEMMATLLLPAGVTSMASIKYKDEAELLKDAVDVDEVYVNQVLPGKMKWNLDSLREFNIFQDFLTMLKTVKAVIS